MILQLAVLLVIGLGLLIAGLAGMSQPRKKIFIMTGSAVVAIALIFATSLMFVLLPAM